MKSSGPTSGIAARRAVTHQPERAVSLVALQYRIHASDARMATRALDASVPEAWRRTVVAEGVRDPVGPRDELVRQLFGHLN